ncbi:MAG: transcriptional repressor [Clostridia bacterium]|nr:transcriptional repressor [Clostridia bacterium]
MRNTTQRTEILKFLRSKRHHCSAVQIYDAVREIIPNISLGTVYRNLGNLLEQGEIVSVEAVDKCIYYDGFTEDHAHFVCSGCKEIYDFPIEPENRSSIHKAGFEVASERVIYYGKCAKCKSADK